MLLATRIGGWIALGAGCAACATLAGCDTMRDAGHSVGSAAQSGWNSVFGPGGPGAEADMKPTQGYAASGKVRFTPAPNGVHVSVDLGGLSPNTEHGFHIHEKGDCSSSDGMTAGGHFNPDSMAHGAYDHPPHHLGDMPNIKADSRGEVHASFDVPNLSIGSGAADLIGHGVIVHRDPDDYKSQPAGNSGPRVSCGIIVKA